MSIRGCGACVLLLGLILGGCHVGLVHKHHDGQHETDARTVATIQLDDSAYTGDMQYKVPSRDVKITRYDLTKPPGL